jgi:SAM-dependent methyltransferase
MERAVFDRMAEQDEIHWWYVARRRILHDLIAREVRLPHQARILEVGCGTGHNFEMLRGFGRLDAIEVDAEARVLASRRLGHAVASSPLPELEGIADRAYHLVALLDVLEHVDGDQAALASLATKLAPGGRILVTVPAHQWMWSAHDVAHHHKRRYSRATLRATAAAAGLGMERIGYFNSLLFPVAAAARVAGRLIGREGSDDRLPPAPLNALLRGIFGLERHMVGRVPLPFGVSLFALLAPRSTR